MSQQLKKLRAIDEQFGYRMRMIVIALTMKPHLHSTHDLRIALRTSHTARVMIKLRNGIKHDMKLLKMKSDDPNRLSKVSFRKQSNDTIMSVLCPKAFNGSNISSNHEGHEKLKLMAEVAM